MTLLEEYTSDELAKELLRREEIEIVIPQPLEQFDVGVFQQLRGLASLYLESLVDDTVRCKDAKHYMYEYVMQMFYGSDIFEKFINPNSG